MNKKKTFYSYFISSVILFIFQLVYHHFSHGVTSQELKWVWVIPMVGGAFLFIFEKILNTFRNRLAFNLFNTGLASYIVGMILKGILEIAGASSPYIGIYRMICTIILGISLFSYISSLLSQGMDK
ncbi:hypothetical protein HQ706_08935 [Enterococcus faecium]|nr:hypothetical protein [Enterococcus faecium]